MELLYNPVQMPEEEIKATFVARQALIDEIISLIERQSDGAGVQHLVIIAPPGMGKTTVMLMVKFAIEDCGLADKWQAVKFTEESPGIYDLADFWLEVLKLLAADTKDRDLERRIKEIETKYRNNEALQEAALALIKDWRRQHDKRFVLLVENLDMILQQINDERDNARLRSVLINDDTMMLIGGATSHFKEAREFEQAPYNIFKIENLADLRFEQMKELLLKRAEADKVENFEQKIEENKGGLRALEYFTGGNPRLVLLLYRVVKNSALKEIQRELEKLLDEVTPLFKHKLENLPPQQRKILDHIARVSGITREGVTPGEIAEAVRLAPNQVSSQLKRLAEMGYVRAANMRRRASYYTLSEPLYAIWYQMRFGRQQRERMGWLITFLKVFYTHEEMPKQSCDLDSHFHERLQAGRLEDVRDTPASHDYLCEAMEDIPMRIKVKERVIHSYLEINDSETVKRDLLPTVNLEDLSKDLLEKLVESGCINEEQALGAIIGKDLNEEQALRASIRKDLKAATEEEKEFAEEVALASVRYFRGKFEEALKHLDRALEIKPIDDQNWYNRGLTLSRLGRFDEAVASYDHTLEIKPNDDKVLNQRSLAHLFQFMNFIAGGNFDGARSEWLEALKSWEKIDDSAWQSVVSEVLFTLAQTGKLHFVRELIAESNLEERVFPLARALDYLQADEEAEKEELLEKLSPEVRGIVEEVIARLQVVAPKSTRPKAKSTPSRLKPKKR
jgi:tetratricopeptide (TPR) repeat protein